MLWGSLSSNFADTDQCSCVVSFGWSRCCKCCRVTCRFDKTKRTKSSSQELWGLPGEYSSLVWQLYADCYCFSKMLGFKIRFMVFCQSYYHFRIKWVIKDFRYQNSNWKWLSCSLFSDYILCSNHKVC